MTQKIKNKTIWVDLDNSPHVVVLEPVINELQKKGYPVVVSVRNCFQVVGMAKQTKMKFSIIGKHFGKNKLLKLVGLLIRSFQLLPLVLKEKPTLAVSHGSRSQLFVCNILGINSILINDYEFCKFFFSIKPKWYIAPEMVIKSNTTKKQFKRQKAYPGIKEDIYVPNFIPDNSIRTQLGVHDSEIMVTIRPPATEAHYHNPQSETLFREAINMLNRHKPVRMVMLPRNERQNKQIKKQWPQLVENRKIIIPDDVVNGLNLIWFSDFVISGGGTMNREATALHIPVYSIFRGPIGAIDRYLEKNNRLVLLESIEDVTSKIIVKKRDKKTELPEKNYSTLNSIVNTIETIVKST